MIENVEATQDNMTTQEGIGLFKIRYEMDVAGSSRNQSYTAGVIAYSSREAVNTLVEFAKDNVTGFKGMKIEEVGFEGNCHALSKAVEKAILGKAIVEGVVIPKEQHELVLEEATKAKKTGKKSIIPKDKK